MQANGDIKFGGNYGIYFPKDDYLELGYFSQEDANDWVARYAEEGAHVVHVQMEKI